MNSGQHPTGATALAGALERLGVKTVFAVPGTQTLPVHEALRSSTIRTVVPRHELSGSFMAGGYFRACDEPGILITIGGPGFTYGLTGLAEARSDSAAVINIVCKAPPLPDRRFQVQAIDEAAVAASLVKATFRVTAADDVAATLMRAYAEARAGEPGPVVVQFEAAALTGQLVGTDSIPAPTPRVSAVEPEEFRKLERAVASARRLVILAGQGAQAAATDVAALAERLNAPVVTTSSGRGVLREDHPLALADVRGDGIGDLNGFLATADVVLGLGVKLSDSGTAGFRLRLPPDRFVHIDASAAVLGANYPSAVAIEGDVGAYVRRLLEALPRDRPLPSGWPTDHLRLLRERMARSDDATEPTLEGTSVRNAETFFRHLRAWLPDDAIVTTDSGLHQTLVRRYLRILAPRGLLIPSGFQSMGFGIPAAIGAKLAAPARPVLAVVGDGGFQMAGMEILTAVAERVPLTVCVLTDGFLGLIRMQQIHAYGRTADVGVPPLQLQEFAAAAGVTYVGAGEDVGARLTTLSHRAGVNLVEVRVRDSLGTYRYRATRFADRVLPARLMNAARRILGR
jgi:acetolactate synthase-1/2/3 large subunit